MTGESGQVWKDRGKHHQVYRCIYYGMLPTAVLTGVEVLLMGAVGAFGWRIFAKFVLDKLPSSSSSAPSE